MTRFREAADYTQEELATIAGVSVHGISALERGERRRHNVETVRALSAALDLSGPTRDALLACAREGQPRLLVLDTFEHVLDMAPLVADLTFALTPSNGPTAYTAGRQTSIDSLLQDIDRIV